MSIIPNPSPQEDEEEQGGQNSLANTLGLIIFLLAVGSQFIQPLFNWLGQFIGAGTANRLSSTLPSLFPLLIVGLVLLTVVISVVSAISSGIGRMRQNSEMRTTTSYPQTSYPQTSYPRPSATSPSYSSRRTISTDTYQPGVPSAPNMNDIFPPTSPQMRGGAYDKNLPRAPLPGKIDIKAPSTMVKNGQVRTPNFEPILDATVLTYGVLALLIGGAMLGGVAIAAGLLP